MNAVSPELEKQTAPPQAVLMQMTMGFIVSQAISVAASWLFISIFIHVVLMTLGLAFLILDCDC